MTTKSFCDLCGSELSKEEFSRYKEFKIKNYGEKTKGTIRVIISFANHPTGYGGSPDICEKCFKQLLKDKFK